MYSTDSSSPARDSRVDDPGGGVGGGGKLDPAGAVCGVAQKSHSTPKNKFAVSAYKCAVTDCTTRIRAPDMMCKRHWRLLPWRFQSRIGQIYFAFLRDAGKPCRVITYARWLAKAVDTVIDIEYAQRQLSWKRTKR